MDQRYYHTSQLAEMAAVSVRTLRYYDKVGLLSPAHYSEAGYRLYSDEELISLQQILALKYLGFSLEEIKACLKTGPQRLQEVLAQQKAMMKERRAQLDAVIQAIEKTETLLRTDQYNWQSIMHVIQVIQMEQKKEWVKKYFTEEQQQTMEELSKKSYTEEARQKLKDLHPNEWTEDDQKRVDGQYRFVKQALGRLVALGADPASPEAQEVARVKSELGFGFSKGHADIEASLGKWWENFYALPQEQRPIDMTMYTYSEQENELLDKALEIYQQPKP